MEQSRGRPRCNRGPMWLGFVKQLSEPSEQFSGTERNYKFGTFSKLVYFHSKIPGDL